MMKNPKVPSQPQEMVTVRWWNRKKVKMDSLTLTVGERPHQISVDSAGETFNTSGFFSLVLLNSFFLKYVKIVFEEVY
mgnify:CR=1 FL=1